MVIYQEILSILLKCGVIYGKTMLKLCMLGFVTLCCQVMICAFSYESVLFPFEAISKQPAPLLHQGMVQKLWNIINSWIIVLREIARAQHYNDVILARWRLKSPASPFLLNCLFRRRSKKTSKLRVTGFVRGIHRWPVKSPHKGPVTRKRFPFYGVIMFSNDLV